MSTIQQQIVAQAQAQGVPPSLALAVAQHESSFNPNAVGTSGEIGIFQVMPSTAPGVNLADPNTNIQTGVSLLAKYYQQYGGDTASVLTAYNAGPGRVGNPPASTQQYISQVQSIEGQYANLDAADPNSTAALLAQDWASVDGTPPPDSSLDPSQLAPADNTLLYAALAGVAVFGLWVATS